MRALLAHKTGDPSVLVVEEQPDVPLGVEDIEIDIISAGLNRIDLSVRAGYLIDAGLLRASDTYHFGWDVSGRIRAIGRQVHGFAPGDYVVGLRDLLSSPGTHADRVTLHKSAVAPAPNSIDAVRAGALPLALITAYGALRTSDLEAGRTLLVTGAAGPVGSGVVEMAVARGLQVIAHARDDDNDRLTSYGAEAVASEEGGLATAVRAIVPGGVDAVIDAASLGIQAHEALTAGGMFVSLVRPMAPPPLRGTTVVVHEAHADGARLRELVAAVDAGKLHPPTVAAQYPLSEAAKAHDRLAAGGVRGRIVLVPGLESGT